jgi:glycosyltransferase involved in cell wall biosynthesis
MRLFITQVVPNEFVRKYNVSQAGTMFCFDLIDNNCFDNALSLIPANIDEYIKDKCLHNNVTFIQVNRKFFLKIFSNFIENIIIVIKSLKYKTIWYYNITPSNFISAFILRYLFFKQVYAIIADYTPSKSRFNLNNILKFIIEHLKGIITLSQRGVINHKNNITIAGVLPTSKIDNISAKRVNVNNKFLFSGVLSKQKGIDKAIEIFSEIPEAELIISGRGDFDVENAIKNFNNIKYLGFLTQQEYKRVLSEVTFCLNFRNPSYPENENDFPSKVLEYFSYNKVVISTIKYPELYSFNYFYTPFDNEKITKLVKRILNLSEEKLNKYNSHTDKLKESFSEKIWKSTLLKIENNQH